MGEPNRTTAAAEWWRGLSRAWRANIGMYCLAVLALAALITQLFVGGGQSRQRVEVASRAPATSTPNPPRFATTTPVTVPATTPGGPGPAAPGTTAAPGPVTPDRSAPPVPLSVGPTAPPASTAPEVVCQNSTNPVCGAFYWDPAPGPNQGLTVTVTATPSNPTPGDVVTFAVTVTDPDHKVTDNCAEIDFGDGNVDNRPCVPPDCPDAHGPWQPLPPAPGAHSFSYSHPYGAGSYRATFTYHTDSGDPCPNPYGSANSGQTTLTVQPGP